jgi:hypothetical protein
MPLVNTSLPNLIQGVSQQPALNRFAGQADEQVNAISSVVDGLTKRPNTRHLSQLLTTAVDSNSFVHFIDRSENEKYVTIHDGTSFKAWNLDGTPCTINGVSSYATSTSNYINTSNPKNDLKGLTVGDTTFLLNKKKTVVASTSVSPDLEKLAVVTITQGDYEKNYRVDATVSPNAVAPANLTLPTFSITLERYLYHAYQIDHLYGREYHQVFRWRVASIAITNGGANVTDSPSLTITSSHDIYAMPTFEFTVTSGTVTAATVTSQGAFEGYNGTGNLNSYDNSDGDYIREHDYTPPTISQSISSGYVVTTVDVYAKEQSGGSGGSSPTSENANSDKIAKDLNTRISASTADTSGDDITSGNWADYFNNVYNTNSNNIYLSLKNQGNDFEITTHDSLSDTGMSVAYKQVADITDLPTENKNGFGIKVSGSTELNEDDYYVEFETNQGGTYGDGTYNETVGFGISIGIKNDTMPHTLVLTAPNTFTLQTASYTTRKAGDEDTNPQPSFVNSQISNIFFFKNRLGFLTEDKIVLSEAGEPFNFFRTTVTTLLDSDPIDVQVSTQKVTNLKSAVGFQENLILFSENAQFVLKGGELLTPKSVSISPVTNFDASSKANPIPLGAYMYFPVESENFTSLREYTVNASTDVYDSTDITEHVPAYIPSNVRIFAGSSTKDVLVLTSDDEPNAIYVYRFFFNGQKKLLSSWFKFTLDGDIRGLHFSQSDLFIVVSYNNNTQLVKMPFTENLRDKEDAPTDFPNSEHTTYLDFRTLLTVAQGDTSVALPYNLPVGSLQCYTGDGGQISGSNSSTHFNFSSPITAEQAGKIWVGKNYTMSYVFSELIFKDQAGSGQSATNSTPLMLKNGTIFYSNTKTFTVEVEPINRDKQSDTFSADIVGQTVLGDLKLDSGKFRFPIFSNAQDTKITVTDSSVFPVQLTSAEFEGLVKPRSKRVG